MSDDLLVAHASAQTGPPEKPPVEAACPSGVPADARCLRGRDSMGAHYLIVIPRHWSGVLVVHAHGGPPLGEPKTSRAEEDIKRWSATVRLGHAWAGSVFRQGGFAVTSAAQDTERLRRIFVEHVATPTRTVIHGQSWGALVATKAAELYPKSWDGMLLTSGAVGGLLAYEFRLDLRVIYQYLCNNHPKPDESAYPLSIGLPKGSTLTEEDLAARADEALGLLRPAAQRSPEQARRLRTLVDLLKIPEAGVIDQLRWGTWALQDVVEKHGGSPLDNDTVRYSGADDDAALNATALRYRADSAARARFAAEIEYSGRFPMPVLTVHGIQDPTCFVEVHDVLRSRMNAAGNEHNLVQTFVDSDQHSYLGDEIYPPLFEALLRWIENGDKPTPHQIADRCRALTPAALPPRGFVADYVPRPLASRVHPR